MAVTGRVNGIQPSGGEEAAEGGHPSVVVVAEEGGVGNIADTGHLPPKQLMLKKYQRRLDVVLKAYPQGLVKSR